MKTRGHSLKLKIVVAILAVTVIGGTQLDAAAHYVRPKYTWSGDSWDCGHRIDPINVVFRGSNAYFGRVFDHVKYHNWGDHEDGSRQWLRDHGQCSDMNGQLASRAAYRGRFHIRLWQRIHPDPDGRTLTVGDAHHEDVSNQDGISPAPCHAVDQGTVENPRPNGSGFDWGRRRMEDLFSASHAHRIVNKPWGNTDPFRQCDGEYAGSNGTALLITMGKM